MKVERKGLEEREGEKINGCSLDTKFSVVRSAVERSIMAWTTLMTEENSDQIKPHISLLKTIKQIAETKFPHARDCIRPGFDEVETVM